MYSERMTRLLIEEINNLTRFIALILLPQKNSPLAVYLGQNCIHRYTSAIQKYQTTESRKFNQSELSIQQSCVMGITTVRKL